MAGLPLVVRSTFNTVVNGLTEFYLMISCVYYYRFLEEFARPIFKDRSGKF